MPQSSLADIIAVAMTALEQSSPGGALPPQQLQNLAQGTGALALDLSLRTAPPASTK